MSTPTLVQRLAPTRTLALRAGQRGAPLALLLGGAAWLTALLIRYPFDGLYGQDSYAYYYQALELWREAVGRPLPAWPFAGEGLFHWPVGYHLHLMLGFLFGAESPAGGRALTLTMALLTPVLVYLLAGALFRDMSPAVRTLAGLVAGGALLVTGIYARYSLALMADVPAVFWATLAVWCWVRAWSAVPPSQAADAGASLPPSGFRIPPSLLWAAGAGGALGIAILVRYGTGLLLLPLLAYTLLQGRQAKIQQPKAKIAVAVLAGGVALLLPELGYRLGHPAEPADLGWLPDWSVANWWQTTVHTSDGTATFSQPMSVFYLLEPLGHVGVGFLAPLWLPALALGFGALAWQRRWPALGLLASWWLGWALFLSGSPYQTHRFVIGYLPPLVLAIGLGGALAAERLLRWGQARGGVPATRRIRLSALLAALVLVSLAGGLVQSVQGAKGQAAQQAQIKNGELAVIALAQQAAATAGGAPRVACFGLTAALYHYTGWAIEDIYTYDEAALDRFLRAPGPRLVVVSEASMATQWVGTPSGDRWTWLQAHYTLQRAGTTNDYTVFIVGSRR